ncbi:MAG: hypothetical protein ACLQVI_33950 [Polyangiaceae bacterium]
MTLGGEAVESNEFEFPVTFTFGQLVANGWETDPLSQIGFCLAPAKPVDTCIAGQDGLATASSVVGVPTCSGLGDASTIIATPDAGNGETDAGP